MNFDFSGYATRNNLKCSDGRTIQKDAFKDNDGQKVPLVWQHIHNDPANVLGHAILENREDGVYTYGKFNDTEAGRNAKTLVEHGDICALSIYANGLVQKGNAVLHGAIREVSLVLTGANPGAFIDNLSIQHGDGSYDTDETEAIIYMGGDISMSLDKEKVEHSAEQAEGKTVKDVFDGMTEEQKTVVYAMIGLALQEDEEDEEDEDVTHFDDEGEVFMKNNVFDNSVSDAKGPTLSHAQIREIMVDAEKVGSLKDSFLYHAAEYGIEDIDFLFPDAKLINASPEFIKRRTEWVAGVIDGTHHTPFSRIKSTAADITADEARAKGYITGKEKKEEVIKLLKRTTGPTTIYKKQKLDRDDIVDITDLDVVAWLKAEMRVMLDEELARAILVGDGRDVEGDDDKINEECIRPIYTDNDLYAHHTVVKSDATTLEMIENIIRARKDYKGSGNPILYTTTDKVTDMLLLKDKMDRRIYNSTAELANALRVAGIVEVEVMENLSRTVEVDGEEETRDLIGIMVNLKDYVVGADKGGQVSMFDDFDIDFNQYKYLMETRCSGALIKPKSAVVIEKVQASDPQ